MIKVPVSVVPRARIDCDAEARQILGQSLVLSDGCAVPPLTAARLVALELVSSPFFLHPFECDALDAAAAVVLLSCDRSLIPELTAADPSALRAAAASWFHAHADSMLESYPQLVDWVLDVPFYGLVMIPGDPAVPREFWFDGTFIGGVVAAAAKLLATPVDRVLWETPLCTVGHALAQHASACGVKGVERPPDRAALKRIMAEASAREQAGILHPWQFRDPLNYGLTDTQAAANPALMGIFARMRAEFERNGHRPLDPDDYPCGPAPDADPCPPPGTGFSVSPAPVETNTITVQAPPAASPASGQESILIHV